MNECNNIPLEGSFSAVSKLVLQVHSHLAVCEIYNICAILYRCKLNVLQSKKKGTIFSLKVKRFETISQDLPEEDSVGGTIDFESYVVACEELADDDESFLLIHDTLRECDPVYMRFH